MYIWICACEAGCIELRRTSTRHRCATAQGCHGKLKLYTEHLTRDFFFAHFYVSHGSVAQDARSHDKNESRMNLLYDTHTVGRPNRARREGAGKRDGKTTYLSISLCSTLSKCNAECVQAENKMKDENFIY